MENEIWKQIADFDKYEVSNTGKVRSIKTGRILKPHTNVATNYQQVILRKDNKSYNRYLHRLVLTNFKQNEEYDNYTNVIHKDGNRYNNNAENLEWSLDKPISAEIKIKIIREINKAVNQILDKYITA